jgi:hypothetical protein
LASEAGREAAKLLEDVMTILNDLKKAAKEESTKPIIINFTPFIWKDASKIPMRDWLYDKHYIRKFASAMVSSGGVGKSSLLIVEALAMVTSRDLLNFQPKELLRVCYWNGEDPMEELERRFAAVNKYYNIKPDEIGDRLFLDSGRILPITIAEDTKTGINIATPLIDGLIKALQDNHIDVLIIDPFISCHHVNENDNTAINKVAAAFSFIAEKANCSIMLAHHTRKVMNGNNVTTDDGRGASSLRDAVRASRALNNMTDNEAEAAQITQKQRPYYFSADKGKHNMSPPADKEWFNLVSIDMENGPIEGEPGEQVGVVTAWEYPQAVKPTVTSNHIKRAQDVIRAGGPWRESAQSVKEPWVGIPIALVMGVNTANKPDRKWINDLVLDWIMEGFLKRVEQPDGNRKAREYIEAGDPPPAGYYPKVPF